MIKGKLNKIAIKVIHYKQINGILVFESVGMHRIKSKFYSAFKVLLIMSRLVKLFFLQEIGKLNHLNEPNFLEYFK